MPSQNDYSKIHRGMHENILVEPLTEIDVGMTNEYVMQ